MRGLWIEDLGLPGLSRGHGITKGSKVSTKVKEQLGVDWGRCVAPVLREADRPLDFGQGGALLMLSIFADRPVNYFP